MFMKEKLYVVHWKEKQNINNKGHGLPMKKLSADASVEKANKDYTSFIHWSVLAK